MKSFSIRSIIVCFSILISAFSFAQQSFQGKAFYESKTTMDMDFGGREMSPEIKKRIAERMKSMFEKTYILTFNKSESTYKEEEKLESPGGQGGGFRMMGSLTGGLHYKNVKDGNLLQEQEFFGKQFLINDSLPKLEWTMSGETKQIGNYTCYKATAIKKVDEFDFRSMRPRPSRDRQPNDGKENVKEKDTVVTDTTKTQKLTDLIDVPKEVTVTAWYTPQIPVSQGPGEYHGLPGLILEVNSDRTTILCSKIILNPEDKEELKIPSKGKEVTRKEYNDIMKKKMEEMREMYSGRGRGGERHIRIRG
ncbi:MAG: GLPGLI family protein [Bacteroidia bacterium]|nr:GLPGLI family protein [Bacteroidia bacterium]